MLLLTPGIQQLPSARYLQHVKAELIGQDTLVQSAYQTAVFVQTEVRVQHASQDISGM